MKRILFKCLAILLIAVFVLFNFTGCYGKFALTTKLYKWNGSLGDKWVNTIVMWVLMIVPVYSLVGFVDFAILNVIEFWTGKNPMAMGPGEIETQLVELDGNSYQITATKNRFDIVQQDNNKKISLVFNEETKSWYVESETNDAQKIAELDPANLNLLRLIQPDGEIVNVDLEQNKLLLE